jgi:hypothetical protein
MIVMTPQVAMKLKSGSPRVLYVASVFAFYSGDTHLSLASAFGLQLRIPLTTFMWKMKQESVSH